MNTQPTTQVSTSRRVVGMTCGHCESAIRTEVGAIDGVTDVHVDLTTGQVNVTSTHPISEEQLADAIHEAGYQLAS